MFFFSRSNRAILERQVLLEMQLCQSMLLKLKKQMFAISFLFLRYCQRRLKGFPILAILTSTLPPVQIFFEKASFSALSPLPTKTVFSFPCVATSDSGWENGTLVSYPTGLEGDEHSGTVSGCR